MSGGKACACDEKAKPVNRRAWQVLQYRCNHSAFSGYHETPSDYSSVQCTACGAIWRTKAMYTVQIRHRGT